MHKKKNMNLLKLFLFSILASFTVFLASCTDTTSLRQTIRLDGEWKIVKTDGSLPAGAYTSAIPVPGLVDLTVPALDTAGTRYPMGRTMDRDLARAV